MNPRRPRILTVPPPTLEKQLQVLEAIRRLWGDDVLRKAGYNPAEPRVPKHNPAGGEWTHAGTQVAELDSDDASPIQGMRGGHHFVSGGVFRKLPLRPETRQVFERFQTGPLQAGPHRWSAEHAEYNRAVDEALQEFLKRNGIQPQDMTPAQAEEFTYEVIASRDPRIREFNLKLYRREILYYLRRVPPRAPE